MLTLVGPQLVEAVDHLLLLNLELLLVGRSPPVSHIAFAIVLRTLGIETVAQLMGKDIECGIATQHIFLTVGLRIHNLRAECWEDIDTVEVGRIDGIEVAQG